MEIKARYFHTGKRRQAKKTMEFPGNKTRGPSQNFPGEGEHFVVPAY